MYTYYNTCLINYWFFFYFFITDIYLTTYAGQTGDNRHTPDD